MNVFSSPKTTFLGLAAVIAVIAKWVQHGFDANDLPAFYNDIVQLLLGLGLIQAKDFNITGGEK